VDAHCCDGHPILLAALVEMFKGFDMDNYSFLNDDNFLEAKEKKQPYFFKNIGLDLLTWQDIIIELERHIQNGIQHEVENNLRFILLHPIHPKIINFIQEFKKLQPNLRSNAHIYLAMLTNSGGIGRHKDNEEVIFWQVCGKTHWTVEAETNIQYILEPNDAIYIPANMYHKVITLTPRAGISFGLEYD
jgi:mannose-6-phosphate isomerase-like protein (cupin superfamily)